jgi:hypothetical protein
MTWKNTLMNITKYKVLYIMGNENKVWCLLLVGHMAGLLADPKDGDTVFLQNISELV